MMQRNIVFISENYYLKSAPIGEYTITFKSTAAHDKYKTIAAGYEKAIHLTVTENSLKCNRELALVN